MKGKSLARWLTGLFLGLLLTLNFVHEAGAGNLVRLISPQSGAVLSGEVTIQAVVASSEVSYVVFGVDEQRPHSTNAAPYRFLLNSGELSNGPHQLFVEAYSRGGLLGRSAPIKVTVKNYFASPQIAKPGTEAKAEIKFEVQAPAVKLRSEAVVSAGGKAVTTGNNIAPLAALSAEPKLSGEMVSSPPVGGEVAKTPAFKSAPPADGVSAAQLPAFLLNNMPLAMEHFNFSREGRFDGGFRKVLEASGWQVSWVAASKTGIACARGSRLEVTLGSDKVLCDGVARPLGGRATLQENKLITPLRGLCEAAGMTLTWESRTRTVRLISPYLALVSSQADCGAVPPAQ